MPSTSAADHFSAVFADYSASAAALAVSGVPAVADVQRRTHTSADDIVNPHVLFEVTVDPEQTDTLLTLTLNIRLKVQIGTETGQTTRAAAHAWLQALRSLFDDDHITTWDAFLAAQTDGYKNGWHIQSVWPQAIADEYGEDKALLTLTAPFQIISYWNND